MPEELKRPVISKIVNERGGDLNMADNLVGRLDYFEKILKTPEDTEEQNN